MDLRITALCTLNDRPVSVMEKVFDSMKGQDHDELLVVLDQTPVVLSDFCLDFWQGDKRFDIVFAPDRPPGWRSPVKAWNAGFQRAKGQVLYCFSSETIQAEGNLARTREMFSGSLPNHGHFYKPGFVLHGKAECSCGPEGNEVNWGEQAPGNLFSDAAHPRPLGFIWAAPTASVRKIGGFDESFAEGFWFDDDDLFYRLWQQGLDFVFDDSVSGVHQHHERPTLETPAGQAGIARNRDIMLRKYGTVSPWTNVRFHGMSQDIKPGRTIWRHL